MDKKLEECKLNKETCYLLNSQKNKNRILEACTRNPKERLQFNTVKDLENEVRNK